MHPTYTDIICLRTKQPLFIVLDNCHNVYRMDLPTFLKEVVEYPNKSTRRTTEVPHIVCLRAMERDLKNRLEIDFCIHTMVTAPDSVFGGSSLYDIFWMLWNFNEEKMKPQP